MNRREAMAALMSLPATAVISEAKVQPNDVIVLECDEFMTKDTMVKYFAYLQSVWPNHKVVVLDKGMKLRIAKGA